MTQISVPPFGNNNKFGGHHQPRNETESYLSSSSSSGEDGEGANDDNDESSLSSSAALDNSGTNGTYPTHHNNLGITNTYGGPYGNNVAGAGGIPQSSFSSSSSSMMTSGDNKKHLELPFNYQHQQQNQKSVYWSKTVQYV